MAEKGHHGAKVAIGLLSVGLMGVIIWLIWNGQQQRVPPPNGNGAIIQEPTYNATLMEVAGSEGEDFMVLGLSKSVPESQLLL